MAARFSKGILTCLMMLSWGPFAAGSSMFSFTGSNYGPSATAIPAQTIGGISATETGYWVNANNSGATVTGATNDFASAWIGEYSGAGLGICNPNEQPGCASPQHQIDNYQGLDFVNFSFSTAVNLSDVYVVGFGNPTGVSGSYNDVDLSYALLTAAQEMSLVSGTLALDQVSFTTMNTNFYGYNDYSLSGTGQYLLVGAAVTPYYGDISTQATPDAFKIQTLTVTATQQTQTLTATPEPASFLLFGSALLVGALVRRRISPKVRA